MQDFHVAGLVALGRFPLLFPVAILSIKEVFFLVLGSVSSLGYSISVGQRTEQDVQEMNYEHLEEDSLESLPLGV